MAHAARLLGIIALIAFVVGPAIAHFELVAPLVGFGVFALGILLALIATVLALVALVRGAPGVRSTALAGLVLGVLVIAVTVAVARGGSGVPRINDITTDTENPPQFVNAQTLPQNAGRDMAYPGEEFARQQKAGYPNLAPLRLAEPPDQAFSRVQLAARAIETWEITREDAAARVLEGYDTTPLFRFKDDFVIEVRPADGGSTVQMRSKSRDGQGDTGTNAKRIESFFARLR
jgi:uncharacterized protein (DUF1499 family)